MADDTVNVGDGSIEIHPELDDAALAAMELKLKAALEAAGNDIKVKLGQNISEGTRVPEPVLRDIESQFSNLGTRLGRNVRVSTASELRDVQRDFDLTLLGLQSLADLRGKGIFAKIFGAGVSGPLGELKQAFNDLAPGLEDSGKKAGGGFSKGFVDAISFLPGRMENIFSNPAVAGAVAGIAIELASGFAGAFVATLGLAGIGAGVASAILNNDKAHAGALAFIATIKSDFQSLSQVFADPVTQAFGTISAYSRQFFDFLRPAFANLSVNIPQLTEGLGRMLTALGPPIAELLNFASAQILPVLAEFLPKIGDALGNLLESFNNRGSVQAFGDVLASLVVVLDGLSVAFRVFGTLVDFVHQALAGLILVVVGILQPLEHLPFVGGDVKKALEGMSTAAIDMTGTMGGLTPTSDNAATSMLHFGEKMTDAQKAAQDQKQALDDLQLSINAQLSSLDEAYNKTTKVTDTQIRFTGALGTLDASLRKNGSSLDVNTEAGAKNADSLGNAAKAARDHFLAQIAAHVPIDVATADYNRNTDALRRTAQAAGLNKQQTEALIATYGKIPTDVNTILSLQGLDGIKNDLNALLAEQYALEHGVSVAQAKKDGGFGGAFQGKAAGGLIQGPGGPKDDVIPAWVSNGEYVINAAATAANLPLLHAINNANGKRFAQGGFVGQRQHADWPFPIDVSKTKVPTKAEAMAALAGHFGGIGGPGGIGGAVPAGIIGAWIQAASKYTNIEWPEGVFTIIMRESGGNPNSINLWDSNAQAGHPSIGLMQTIPGTFQAYRDPRLPDNIRDPVANIVAAVNYIHSRYGSIFRVQQAHAELPPQGYHAGGPVLVRDQGGPVPPGYSTIFNGTGKDEFIQNPKAGSGINLTINLDGKTVFQDHLDASHDQLISALMSGRDAGGA